VTYPVDNLGLISFECFLPYYDSSTDTIVYQGMENAFMSDVTTNTTESINWMNQMSWANKANPDWLNLYDSALDTTHVGLTGSGNFDDENITALDGLITQAGAEIDYWWGTNTFAKFGSVSFEQEFPQCCPEWINYSSFSAQSKNKLPVTGFVYTLLPGVIANMTTHQKFAVPQIYVIDPPYFTGYWPYPPN
jgi:hypothetical protein